MKINMAEGEYFTPGMIVRCTTCHGLEVEGEVMAFDLGTKIIALKSPGSNGKPNVNDVRLINLNLVSEVNVIRQTTEPAAPLTNLNSHRLTHRVRLNIEEKMRKVNYIGVGVTPQAQSLFHTITKTITDVKWDGQNIVVMNDVIISPPYAPEHCRGKDGSNAIQHVKKLVEKFQRETLRQSSADFINAKNTDEGFSEREERESS